jgi:hypothetical protein
VRLIDETGDTGSKMKLAFKTDNLIILPWDREIIQVESW